MRLAIEHGSWSGVLNCRRSDDSTFPGQISAVTMVDHQGQPQALVSIVRDMSERVELEASIWQTMELLQQVIDHCACIDCRTDLQGCYLIANHAFASELGYEREALIGINQDMLKPPDDVCIHEAYDQQAISSGKTNTIEQERFIQGQLRTLSDYPISYL
ncbi:MAG: PAS domain S-box protein [Chloroflexaceae bacterium]|nr:PAS domain S-box protein [Chloroflexaceae bacterium]